MRRIGKMCAITQQLDFAVIIRVWEDHRRRALQRHLVLITAPSSPKDEQLLRLRTFWAGFLGHNVILS